MMPTVDTDVGGVAEDSPLKTHDLLIDAPVPDRRGGRRLRLDHGQARIRTPEGQTAELLDIGMGGLALHATGDLLAEVKRLPVVIELLTGRFAARIEPIRAEPARDGFFVGARFHDLDAEGLRVLARFLVDGFARERDDRTDAFDAARPTLTTQDQKFIHSLLAHACVREGRSLQAYAGHTPLPARLSVVAVEDGGLRVEASGGHHRLLLANERYDFTLPSGAALYGFRAKCLSVDDTGALLEIPSEMRQAGFRDSVRIRLAPEAEAAQHPYVSFRAAAAPGETIRRPLEDVAGRGFSFRVDMDREILVPGMRLPDIRIRLADRDIRASGLVRNVTTRPGTPSFVCGVEISLFGSTRDADSWYDFVFQSGHPHIKKEQPDACGIAWNLLKTSDYVRLWTPRRERPRLARRFGEAWGGMSRRFGHLLTLRDDIRPIGTVAASLLYPRTWMLHHFGVDKEERTPKQRREFLAYTRELYSAIMYMIQHFASAEHFVIYVERSKRWNELMYGYFVNRYSMQDDFVYSDLEVHECLPAHVDYSAPAPKCRVVGQYPHLMADFCDHLRARVTPLEMRAFGYGPDEMTLEGFSRTCREHGYERSRFVFFAVDAADRPVAAMVTESGGEGVNIFGLMNSVRLVDLAPEHEDLEDARNALLLRAIDHFRALDKRNFLLYADELSGPSEVREQCFRLVSPGIRWLVKRNVVPAWLSYVDDLLAVQDK